MNDVLIPEETKTVLPYSPEGMEDVVKRYTDAFSVQTLAEEQGISPQALYARIEKYLAQKGDQSYEEIKRQAVFARKAFADYLLLTASNQLEIARAQHLARYARMDCERYCPEIYGLKREVRQTGQVDVVVARREYKIINDIDTRTR
jgi:predicted DNA-binding protein YlxM (UPF0122 family)